MLIIALVLALIGLVALVFAVVTSNELVAWVCIGASVLGVVLLIVDAVRERQQESDAEAADASDDSDGAADADTVDYPEEVADDEPSDSDVVDDVPGFGAGIGRRGRPSPPSTAATRAPSSARRSPGLWAWRAVRAPRRR